MATQHDNRKPAPPSTPPLTDRERVKRAMKRLAVLGFAPIDPDAIEVYRERYLRMLRQVGQKRFEQAVDWCLDNMTEYPKPVQFRDAIPQPVETGTVDPLAGMTPEQIAEGKALFKKFIEESEAILQSAASKRGGA